MSLVMRPLVMRPLVMGVLNVTPDSFSDGGLYFDTDAAIAHGAEMAAEGADIVDVGGESSRPGARPVAEAEELRRVLPVVEGLQGRVRVSVDTAKPAVARAALRVGASMLNDITASMPDVAAEAGAGWVAMHMRGDPRTMQDDPRYQDVVGQVTAFLEERVRRAARAGVEELFLDPGIGFGKSVQHNLALMAGLGRLVDLGHPVAVGVSRKSFLARIIGEEPPPGAHDRLEPSLALAVWATLQGVALIRVHDVAATVRAVRLVAGEPGETGGGLVASCPA